MIFTQGCLFNRGFITEFPACLVVMITLSPPSVHNADIGDCVHGGFHAARPAGLKRSFGIIQPCMDPGNHHLGNIHVIPRDKDQFGQPVGFIVKTLLYIKDLFYNDFARFVVRMCLAGENEINRPIPACNNF